MYELCLNSVTCVGIYVIKTVPYGYDNDRISKPEGYMSQITQYVPTGLSDNELQRLAYYQSRSMADNTKKAYGKDWEHFSNWCQSRGLTNLPASKPTIVAYVLHLVDDLEYKVTTVERRLASINVAHRLAGEEKPAKMGDPHLRGLWGGVTRTKRRKKDKVEPLLIEDIRHICNHLPNNIRGVRDRAILLIGFAGAFRRSEIANVRLKDIVFTLDGLKIYVPNSKRDQEGEGLWKGIPYGENPLTCPVKALASWIDEGDILDGYVFRSITRHGTVWVDKLTGHSIAQIVKKACKGAGMNPKKYSGHSLRSGFCTQAARSGAPEHRIMAHTGHKSIPAVRDYIHIGNLFEGNPVSLLGL